MSARARASVLVGVPPEELGALVRDPHAALPVISGFGTFTHHLDLPDSRQQWDVVFQLGSLQLGGRIEIDTSRPDGLDWRSVRGTRHTLSTTVSPAAGGSRLSLEMTLHLKGLLMARIAERTGAGIMRRHLQAAAEQLRHHAEWCR